MENVQAPSNTRVPPNFVPLSDASKETTRPMRPLCGAFFAGPFFAEPDPGVNPSLGQPSDERALNGAATATAICH